MHEYYYEIIKSLHIISVISWMAGLLYLPRLYAYHADVKTGSEADEIFKIMEKRLLRIIINPAMILTLLFGVMLISYVSIGAWFHLKMLLVLWLLAFHGILAKYRKDFENNKNTKSSRYYKLINEIPTIIMIVIVFIVVIKPFL